MRQFWCSLAGAVMVLSCVSGPPPTPQGGVTLRRDVYVQRVVSGVWRHVSYRRFPEAGFVPSNGLVVEGALGALIVDTAWNPEQTASILDWVRANIGPIRALIVTHAHDDRLGGLAEAHRHEIPSYALSKTVESAAKQDWPAIEHGVTSGFPLDGLGVGGEVFYPGAAHTVDNATVWLREARVLVGGCLVRSAAATSMGYTGDGDLENWPRAVTALQERYPNIRIVVPGHGDPGGQELLTHTLELLGQ